MADGVLYLCPRCGNSKSLSDFYKNTKRGRQRYCKSCCADYTRIRTQKPEVRAATNARLRAKRAEHRRQIALVTPPATSKICSKCHLDKPFSEFGPKKSGSGIRSRCRICEARLKREWLGGKSPDERRQIRRAAYLKEQNKTLTYMKENRARFRELSRKWRAQNPDYYKELYRKRRALNPERYNVYARKRRALKYEADGSHSVEDIATIRKLQKDKCAACRKPLKDGGEVDHIVALSCGGSNFASNLQLLCMSCNRSKHVRDNAYFMRERGFLF